MYDNNPTTLLNLRRLPARVDYQGAAYLLNFEVVAIRALVELGLSFRSIRSLSCDKLKILEDEKVCLIGQAKLLHIKVILKRTRQVTYQRQLPRESNCPYCQMSLIVFWYKKQ